MDDFSESALSSIAMLPNETRSLKLERRMTAALFYSDDPSKKNSGKLLSFAEPGIDLIPNPSLKYLPVSLPVK